MNKETIKILKKSVNLSLLKKDTSYPNVSLAVTKQGNRYVCGNIQSYNHLLDLSSEQNVVALASQCNDYKITELTTMYFDPVELTVNPLIIKFLIDHSIRSDQSIKYTVIDAEGIIKYSTDDVKTSFLLYKSSMSVLQRINDSVIENNFYKIKNEDSNKVDLLRKYSKLAVERNFPTEDKSSGYGCCVITDKGNLYYAGQYSSPDHRLMLHAEMNVLVKALSENDINITEIGLVSTKHIEISCQMCGCCRQFYTELVKRNKVDPKIYTFSYDGKITNIYNSIAEYLPFAWDS